MLSWNCPWLNDVYIKVFGKLKTGLEYSFIKHWLNSIEITGPEGLKN